MCIGAREAEPYPMLFRYLARARAGEEDAAAELAESAAQLKEHAWPYPLIEMFLGQPLHRDVLASATERPHQHIEAQFCLAQWHLLRGNLDKAKRHLRTVVGRYPPKEPEYALARADLRRLGALRWRWR
jgi:rhomboid protease GluP